jgi:hypothetical protein
MTIINLNEVILLPFTADTTEVTADSTQYTADMTLIGDGRTSLLFYPREYLGIYNVKIYETIKDKEIKIEDVEAIDYGRGIRRLLLDGVDFESGTRYMMSIYNPLSNELVWRGKILATDSDDIQNYKTYEEDENNIIEA